LLPQPYPEPSKPLLHPGLAVAARGEAKATPPVKLNAKASTRLMKPTASTRLNTRLGFSFFPIFFISILLLRTDLKSGLVHHAGKITSRIITLFAKYFNSVWA
jgi:hypothetical protein